MIINEQVAIDHGLKKDEYVCECSDIDDAEKYDYVKHIHTEAENIYLSKYRKVKPQGLRLFNGTWYLGAIEDSKFKTFKLDYIENMRLGNKENLYKTEYKNIKFSWEELEDLMIIHISIPDNLYEVNKNVFSHRVVKREKNNLKVIKTNDSNGLLIFLLLCDGSYEIQKLNKVNLIKDLLNV